MHRLPVCGLLLALLLLPGCLISRASTWDRIRARSWQLIRIEGQAPIAGSSITLRLEEPSQLFGEAGVNGYFGSYQTLGQSGLRVSNIAGQHMAGAPELMQQEKRYLRLLERATAVRLENEEAGLVLELLENEQPLLAFTPTR